MEWKNRTLRSMLKGNKEKVLFLFCSGLLLFVISLPDSGKTDPGCGGSQRRFGDGSKGGECFLRGGAGAADPGTFKECGRRRGGGCDGSLKILGGESLACG